MCPSPDFSLLNENQHRRLSIVLAQLQQSCRKIMTLLQTPGPVEELEYGPVHPDLAAALDPGIRELQRHFAALGRLLDSEEIDP